MNERPFKSVDVRPFYYTDFLMSSNQHEDFLRRGVRHQKSQRESLKMGVIEMT
jgi:hypothetical protein